MERNAEAVRKVLYKRHRDPKFREKMSEINRNVLYKRWQDPEFRKKIAKTNSNAMHLTWQNPEFRRKRLEISSHVMYDLNKNPELQEKAAEALRRKWQEDTQFRERRVETLRRTRLNPKNIGNYPLPTIHGYRKDIGFYAQSTWEANFARILLYCANQFQNREKFSPREFYTRENLRLKVTEEFKHLFDSKETEISIDFIVKDPRGNLVLYEMLAHPFQNPSRYAKLEMLIKQYPDVKVRIVDEKMYNRLRKTFEEKINSAPYLSGWETRQDNLKTNPKRYSQPTTQVK